MWRNWTSGTTGRPVPIYYSDRFYYEFLFLTARKILDLADSDDRDGHSILALGLTDNELAGEWVASDPRHPTSCYVQLYADERADVTWARVRTAIQRLRPRMITLKPSLLEALVDSGTRNSESISSRPQLVMSSGASLSADLRAAGEEYIGCPVLNAYGLTEFGFVASECRCQEGLHVDESAVAVQVAADELVFSGVANTAMPLLRYRTHDQAVLDGSRCRCGRLSSRPKGLTGRQGRCYTLSSGALLSPARFNSLFAHGSLQEFQLIQHRDGSFRLLVELADSTDSPACALGEIRSKAERIIADGSSVKVEPADISAGPSFQRFVRER